MKGKLCVLWLAGVFCFSGCGFDRIDQAVKQEVKEEVQDAVNEAGKVMEQVQGTVSAELEKLNWAELIFDPERDSDEKTLKVLYEDASGQWVEVENMSRFLDEIDADDWQKTDAIPEDAEAGTKFSIQQKAAIHLGEEDTDRYYEIATMTLYGDSWLTLDILSDMTKYIDVVMDQENFSVKYTLDRESAAYLQSIGK